MNANCEPIVQLTSKRYFLLVIWAAVLVPIRLAHGDLIINGSFEAPAVPVNSYINFPGGSTLIPGWTVVGVDTSIAHTGFTQNGITFQAQNGIQWADMAGVTSNSPTSGLRQDVLTTIGQQYLLTFYVGSARDNIFFFPATVNLSINGGPNTSYHNPVAPQNSLNWLRFDVPFVATSSTTSLTFRNGSPSYNYLSALDNVSLIAVPEPGIAGLLTFVLSLATVRLRNISVRRGRPCADGSD